MIIELLLFLSGKSQAPGVLAMVTMSSFCGDSFDEGEMEKCSLVYNSPLTVGV
jgi:hypothetical protein